MIWKGAATGPALFAANFMDFLSAHQVTFPIPFQQERNENLHYAHTKFRISAYVAEYIKLVGFSAASVKLLLSLIFLQDQTEEGWPSFDNYKQPQNHFAFVAQIREMGFPYNTRSSRFLRKPVDELANLPEIFDLLEIAPNGRYLTWRFSSNFFYAMANMDAYGLIDVREIALCKGKFGGALLTQIPLNRKKRRPEFRLIGANKGYESNDDAQPIYLTPSKIERQLRPSLQSWADATEMSFGVLLLQEGVKPGYTEIVIRIKHKATEWPQGRFTQRPVSARIWTVCPKANALVEDLSMAPLEGPAFSAKKKG